MVDTKQSCPVTGSSMSVLPAGHPDPNNGAVCPVTNATTSHHTGLLQEHPPVSATATSQDCPVLQKAATAKVCPVVGATTAVLPPDHPAPVAGAVCPATKATAQHHQTLVTEHPPITSNSSAKDCPVLNQESSLTSSEKAGQCPVTGSTIQTLPPNHPPPSTLINGVACPVTQATLEHHTETLMEHPPVTAGATAKDCPVLRQAEESNTCPVVGTAASTLPPAHPQVKTGETCPVTGAKADHHDQITSHPSVTAANSASKCPVSGATAEHHKAAVEPTNSQQAMAQCPVTGQFADGSRPAVVLPQAIAAQPIKYTIYGIPFSTFTRTVTMGLHELQIPFEQIPCAPHSEEILKYNPFGRLPALVLEHSGKQMPMFESDSIVRYLDSADERILRFHANDMVKNQKLEEWIGIISNYVFSAVEQGVVKPYLADKSTDVTKGLEEMHKVLAIVESRSQKPYLMGIATTWADLYLYPILADLAATPYGKELERYEKLGAWTTRMAKRSTAKATVSGTLEGGASPPA